MEFLVVNRVMRKEIGLNCIPGKSALHEITTDREKCLNKLGAKQHWTAVDIDIRGTFQGYEMATHKCELSHVDCDQMVHENHD